MKRKGRGRPRSSLRTGLAQGKPRLLSDPQADRGFYFLSDPASGRTSGNRGNIEKQVPRPSEEGHGARSGESDVGWCGQAACVVTAVYSSTAVGNLGRSGIAKGQGTGRQEQMQVQEDTGNEC